MVEGTPGNSHLQRAADLIASREFERAARAARRALEQSPDDPEAHRILAWALWGLSEFSRAELAARAALRLSPNDADVHSTLALILGDRGKRRGAREHHEQAVSLAPTVATYHTRYARFLLNSKTWSILPRTRPGLWGRTTPSK